jgi:predicted dehydrogenase
LVKQKLRLAVIGLGKMGLLHASLLNVIPEIDLVAICDKSALLSRLYRKVFSSIGVEVVNDVERLVGLDLDVVYVTTPISSHSLLIKNIYSYEIARHIFAEKTLASDYDQAKELCEIARKAKGITMVGYMKRFNVVFSKAKELLTERISGIPKSFKAYAYSSDFLGSAKQSKASTSRGGALNDSGCHVIDLALWLLGDLVVQDVASCVKNQAGAETSVSFSVISSSDLKGQFDVSQSMPNYRMPEFGLSIECDDGRIDVNDDRLLLIPNSGKIQKWYRHDLNDNVYFSIMDPEYFRENQYFVNSVLKRIPCEPSFNTASKVDRLIAQVRCRMN